MFYSNDKLQLFTQIYSLHGNEEGGGNIPMKFKNRRANLNYKAYIHLIKPYAHLYIYTLAQQTEQHIDPQVRLVEYLFCFFKNNGYSLYVDIMIREKLSI